VIGHHESIRDATLCILVQGEPPQRVLLGLKKAGFGAGKYAGFGGKVEAGESVEAAALRELEEEAGVRISRENLRHMGRLEFLFPAEPDWSQNVYVFVATSWTGEPTESREMLPVWFSVDDLPFDHMWQDNAHWLPRILLGERTRGRFTFGADNETIETLEIGAWDSTVE
jgi:8-oxo-dGTP pyrophosphatase MutT (NUDIX family)